MRREKVDEAMAGRSARAAGMVFPGKAIAAQKNLAPIRQVAARAAQRL
jgi:hypothetical protein